ncbi:hypothetical protein VNPA152081_17920 [Pseudomonas aeruginosa]|nr:hypothetical protein VNPA141826_20940 [Pseudomonas aeruginosa]GLF76721.1 hypothetical protein VNPA152081_17920 [Pseudomonas aeruginosa]
MRWERINEWLVRRPDGYAIAKFMDGSEPLFRPSFRGEFIGPAGTKESALERCREHARAL